MDHDRRQDPVVPQGPPGHEHAPSGGAEYAHEHSPGTGAERPGHGGPGASFFDSLRRSGWIRTADRWIGGVAGGVARRLDVDPLLVRGAFVVLTFFGGLGLLLYGLGWALLAEESDGRIHLQEALRGRFDAGLAGALVLVIIGLNRPGLWWHGFWWGDPWATFGFLVVTALVLVVLLWILPRARGERGDAPAPGTGTPPASPDPGGSAPSAPSSGAPGGPASEPRPAPPPPALARSAGGYGVGHDPSRSTGHSGTAGTYGARPGAAAASTPTATSAPAYVPSSAPPDGRHRSIVYAIAGLALVGMAVVQILGRMLEWEVSLWLLSGGVVLSVLGVGLVINGARGRRAGALGGWSVLVALVVVPLTLALAVAPQVRDALTLAPGNVGDAYWAPSSADALEAGHVHTAGRLRADLSALPPDTSLAEPVEITLAAGQLVLDVPQGLDVDVNVQGTGSLRVEQPGTWFAESARVRTDADVVLLRDLSLRSAGGSGSPDIELDVAVGAGAIVIRQVPPAGTETG
ncbi:PspC domain-containing protein [Pseudactinotalea sp. Z1732]|uniref:PspC domain-containing protein n=1 Tax=Pseudactinotalea sp. Z1732 TaxID=3413026 RepID=UPI003C7C1367